MIVELPGGSWAEVRPLAGADEEWLATCPADLRTAAVANGLAERCVTRFGEGAAAVADLLPADRDALLLAVRQLTYGARFDAVQQCPGCGERMDVGFEAGDVPVERRPQASRSDQVVVRTGAGRPLRVTFHLPTCADQEGAAASADPARDLLRRCVEEVDGSAGGRAADLLDAAAVAELEDHMEGMAPAIALAMDLVCPECGLAFAADHDLAAFLMTEMAAAAGYVLREVHTVASRYHWSEREILALPRPRRRAYLELIAEQARREGA